MSGLSFRTVLLIEDNRGDARLLREMFNEPGSPEDVVLTHVGSMSEAEQHLEKNSVDIVLLDLGLPDAQGLVAVQRAHAAAPRVPLVVLTGTDDESLAIQALQEGAQDYLVKGQIEARGLLRALRYAIERKSMEDALFLEHERAQVTLDSIGDAVICTNVEDRITFLNAGAEALTGWSCDEAMNQPMSEVFRLLDAQCRQAASTAMIKTRKGASVHLPLHCKLSRRDEMEIAIEASLAPIHDRDGQPTGRVVIFRDVSTARATALQIMHAAQHDFLTGLPNRALLIDRIDQAIVFAERHTKQVAVLFLDLDGFKHINDSLGHPVGDKLLQSVAKRLLEGGRASDTVSRQGGDEFVVLLTGLSQSEGAAIAARRILDAVSEVHRIDQHELHITTSIGVSVYPDDGTDAETLIKNADTALYQAKDQGRRGYQYFKPVMNERAVERQSVEAQLRRALERNELSLHYQPKIDFGTSRIVGVEALLRWTNATRGSIPPAQFIPVAEACGLILPIGNWVMRRACEQAQAWASAGLPRTTIAVNVSAMEFWNHDFLDGLFAILEETGLAPDLLELELTESVLMKHLDATRVVLRTLRERGVQVAIDDFGTGYSSLSYLQELPIDALKIDQSFIAQITTPEDDACIVNAVIGMGRSLHLRVIAEGVETAAQLSFLRAHQCDEAQGYYFSRPVEPEKIPGLLTMSASLPLLDRAPEEVSATPSIPDRSSGHLPKARPVDLRPALALENARRETEKHRP
jgi:diguanylate cyclase (GGDEF)-like protein/PAS domain S-box-containing protein